MPIAIKKIAFKIAKWTGIVLGSIVVTPLDEWSVEDFGRAVREGVRPNGDSLLVNMPRWSMLDELEISAIWLYIQEQKKFSEEPDRAAL